MIDFTHVNWRPARPADILAVLADYHRLECDLRTGSDPDVTLTLDTPIATWLAACDYEPDGRRLAARLDERWNLGYDETSWQELLASPADHTLGELCCFIATGAQVPEIAAAGFLGGCCGAAGAFFAVRDCLAVAGADVSGLRPSTRLHEYTRRHLEVFCYDIGALTPGRLRGWWSSTFILRLRR